MKSKIVGTLLLFFVLNIQAQWKTTSYTYYGQAIDALSKEKLIFAKVKVKGTTIETTTDFDGNFQINLKEPCATFEVSSLGYATKTQIACAADSAFQIIVEHGPPITTEPIIYGCYYPLPPLIEKLEYSYRGQIIDAPSNETLPFATIKVQGTEIGTTTDIDGNFQIELEKPCTTFEISYVGYVTDTVKTCAEDSLPPIALQPAVMEIGNNLRAFPVDRKISYHYKGQVIDADVRGPLPRAIVQVQGTTIRTTTDVDGHFQIKLEDPCATFEISYLGYLTDTVKTCAKDSLPPIALQLPLSNSGYGVLDLPVSKNYDLIIEGRVLEAKTNEAIVGAKIKVKETGFETSTNSEGTFQLKLDKFCRTFEVRFLGLTTVTQKACMSDNFLHVVMEEEGAKHGNGLGPYPIKEKKN